MIFILFTFCFIVWTIELYPKMLRWAVWGIITWTKRQIAERRLRYLLMSRMVLIVLTKTPGIFPKIIFVENILRKEKTYLLVIFAYDMKVIFLIFVLGNDETHNLGRSLENPWSQARAPVTRTWGSGVLGPSLPLGTRARSPASQARPLGTCERAALTLGPDGRAWDPDCWSVTLVAGLGPS